MEESGRAEAEEVLQFLSCDARTDVKTIALEYFLGLSGGKEGRQFISSNVKYLEAIVDLTGDKQTIIRKNAYLSLVNLATKDKLSESILSLTSKQSFPLQLLQYVLKPDSEYADIVCTLLSNLSRSEIGAYKFVHLMLENQKDVGFEKLIYAFCKRDFNSKAKLHYLGSFFSNLSQIYTARQQILDHSQCVIQRLLPYAHYSDSIIRRGGVVAVLRNCCFDTEHVEWLLSEQVNILPFLLLPLAGGEEFDDEDNDKLPEDLQYLEPDKQREEDPDIRRMLVEAIHQMCATASSRKYIRDKNTYVILRELHKWEKDPGAKYAVENLVSLLISDEPESSSVNLKDIVIPHDVEEKLQKMHENVEREIEEETKQLYAEKRGEPDGAD